MPSCPKCGTMMSPADNVCPSCGTSAPTGAKNYGSSRQQQQVAYVKALPSGHRPMIATALAGMAVIGSIGAFLLADAYKFIPSTSALNKFASTFSAFSSIMPYFLALVGIISLGAAYGFLKGNSWAWKVGLVASALELITITTPNLLGFAVGIVSIYILTTKPIKNWLHK